MPTASDPGRSINPGPRTTSNQSPNSTPKNEIHTNQMKNPSKKKTNTHSLWAPFFFLRAYMYGTFRCTGLLLYVVHSDAHVHLHCHDIVHDCINMIALMIVVLPVRPCSWQNAIFHTPEPLL